MSDSPKYCAARLRAEQERKLRKKRERQAALELAQRKAEEERRCGTRLEQGQRATQNELGVIQAALTALSESDAARFIQVERLEELRDRLRELKIVIQETILEDRVRAASADLRAIREDLHFLTAQAETAKLCEDLAVEEAELVKLERRIAAFDRARSEKFDRPGFQEVTSLLKNARSHLQRQDLPLVRRDTATAQQNLAKHQSDVAERFTAWQAAKDRAEMSLVAVGDRIAGLRADEVVVRWAIDELAALEERLESVAKLVQAEQFEQISTECAILLEAGETIVARVQDLQLMEDRRQYIVNGIVEVMGQMGFVVQQGYPALEHPGVPSSATTIQAERIGGGAVAVSVPQEGEIWYDVSGFPMRAETNADGKEIRSCDEAEEQIVRMHEAMEEAFGIETSELLWDSKDPDRVRKAAERLPESAPAARTRGE